MAKDPAILFYTSDFLTGTMLMTDEEKGQYITLLCIQHQKGRLTEKQVLNICKSCDNEVFSKFTKDENGLYYNERLEFEAIKRKKYSESRSKNRSNKDMNNISKTYDKHMENENENINDIVNTDSKDINTCFSFEEFWDKYPNKVGKSICIKKYKSIDENNRQLIKNTIDNFVNCKPFKEYNHPNPSTYLNQKRWEDEIKDTTAPVKDDSEYYNAGGYNLLEYDTENNILKHGKDIILEMIKAGTLKKLTR